MIGRLNASLIQPLMAWRSGSGATSYRRTLERTQYDSPETIRHRQFVALKAILDHAWQTVPYYRDAWQSYGIHPDDVRSLDDLRHIPILTKTDLREQAERLRSDAYRTQTVFEKTTSGSTGVPLRVFVDEPAMRWKQACTLRSDLWSGYRYGGRIAKVWGNPEYRHFGLKGRLRNFFVDRATYLDTRGIDDARLDAFVETLRRKPPSLLFGHAHSLYLLACHLKRRGIGSIRPDGIISAAMMLHDWQRETIEEVFRTPVTNRYGCEEVSLIASECEVHRGLHLNADSVYAEVVRDDRFPQTDGGGPLVVTDLCNRAMPLIRYQLGDVVVPTDRRCPCGRGLPLIEKVVGREADYVLAPDGKLVSGISLTENFALHIPGTAQVQIVQTERTRLTLRIVPDAEFDGHSRDKISALMAETFGTAMRHDVELVDRIPQEASGKYRFCISPVANDYLKAMAS
jgi:phenylacetate-CoA ligase